MIEHKQINNFIHGIVRKTNLNSYKSILCITNICFDIFALETLTSLTQGLKIVIADREEQIIAERLENIMQKNNIEVMQITPSRLSVLLENNNFKESIKNLKLLLIGGEEIKQNVLDELYRNSNLKIFNVYGPTETTVWSTIGVLGKGEKITIGKPIDNTQIYILKDNQVVPIGITGELCIAGDGLARGYLNREELTKEKFVDNPFEPNTKMYKTGDLAKWLPDGNIEYLGRTDNQVKIRGFRIEPGEIENRLLQHEDIKEAAVTAREDEGEKYICAYVVSDKDIATLDLRGYLKKSLPEYMVPSYFMKLEKMPLTANGKLNRKSLPKPEIEINLNEYEGPRNETEEKLVKIWEEVLGTEKVGINDNFFELGGHSLKVMMLSNRIRNELNIDIPLHDIYNKPTIKEISRLVQNNEKVILNSLNIKLINKFSKQSKLVKYNTELSEEIVLHTDEDSRKVLNYLESSSNNSVLIDYITEYNTLEQNFAIQKIDMDKLGRKLKLRKVKKDEINTILKRLKIDLDELNRNVFSKDEIYRYRMGCVANENCKFGDQKIKRSRMNFIIPFKKKDFTDNKAKILLKLINEQSVFRTSVCFENGLYKFIEHDKLTKINFSIVDLSEYDYTSSMEVIEKIMYVMNKLLNDCSYLNHILYYFAIVKLSLNKYCFLLNIDHLISDINTARIVKMYLEEPYEKNHEILSFNHYLNNVMLHDEEKKFEIFSKSLILKEYREAVASFYNKYSDYAKGEPIKFSRPFMISYNFDNDYKNEIKNGRTTTILESIIYIVVKILYIQFNINTLPIGIITNKRIWGKYKYYNTIGNFVDKIPCTFNNIYNETSMFGYYKKYLDINDRLSKHNIVLKELNGDIEFTKYIYMLSPFSLNYLGDCTPLEDKQYLKNISKTIIQTYPINSYSVNSSILKIIFINGVRKEKIPLIRIFMENLGEICEYKYI
jgi:acyl carrier protein